jgi:hypothetical protein
MYKKILLIFAFGLSCIVSANTNDFADIQLSTNDDPCDCETELDPTFELTNFDTDNCTATFVASPGTNSCVENLYLRYYWTRGGETFYTGTSPTYTFTDIGDLGNVKLKINASVSQAGQELCAKEFETTYTDYICNLLPDDDGTLIVEKQAYALDTDTAVECTYVNRQFDWRVTITNTTQFTNYVMCYYEDVFPTQGGSGCAFTVEAITKTAPDGTITTLDPTILGELNVLFEPGVSTINYRVRAPQNALCANEGVLYNNCFTFDAYPDECPTGLVETFSSGTPEPTGIKTICDSVCLMYGCPFGLSDGFCLDPTEMEAGDPLSIAMNGHRNFLYIKVMEGDILYDSSLLQTPTLTLHPLLNEFDYSMTPNGDGSMHFTIFSNNQLATFNISGGASGTYQPMTIESVFLNDLEECTSVSVVNFQFTDSNGIHETVADPSELCVQYGDTYDSALITTSTGDYCASSSQVLTLTAMGPFNSQDSNYSWSTGETTQTIDVTVGGVYSVAIVDENGCDRSASIALDTCPTICECGDLNAQIELEVIGCQVYASVIQNDCTSLTNINYDWIFSNGNTYNGINPPPQGNSPNGGLLTAKLKVSYVVPGDFAICIEPTVKESIFIPCRGGEKRLNASLIMYPNPTKDKLSILIEGQKTYKGKLIILNSIGVSVIEAEYDASTSKTIELDVSKLNSGIYFVRFQDQNENVIIKKMVVN